MYRIRQHDLPFQGSSHQFVGADNGDVNISVFLLSALPGRGPAPLGGGQRGVRGDVHLSPRFIQDNL